MCKLRLEFSDSHNFNRVRLEACRAKYANTFPSAVGSPPRPVGVAQRINQTFQCIGSILIAPLIMKRTWPRSILASAALFFFLTTISMIVNALAGMYPQSRHGDTELTSFAAWERERRNRNLENLITRLRSPNPATGYTEPTPFAGGQLRPDTNDNKIHYGALVSRAVRRHSNHFLSYPKLTGCSIDSHYLGFRWHRLRFGCALPPGGVNPTLAFFERPLIPL